MLRAFEKDGRSRTNARFKQILRDEDNETVDTAHEHEPSEAIPPTPSASRFDPELDNLTTADFLPASFDLPQCTC